MSRRIRAADEIGHAGGERRRLGPAAHAELGQDIRHVDAHGLLADVELPGDLAIRASLDEQRQTSRSRRSALVRAGKLSGHGSLGGQRLGSRPAAARRPAAGRSPAPEPPASAASAPAPSRSEHGSEPGSRPRLLELVDRRRKPPGSPATARCGPRPIGGSTSASQRRRAHSASSRASQAMLSTPSCRPFGKPRCADSRAPSTMGRICSTISARRADG